MESVPQAYVQAQAMAAAADALAAFDNVFNRKQQQRVATLGLISAFQVTKRCKCNENFPVNPLIIMMIQE